MTTLSQRHPLTLVVGGGLVGVLDALFIAKHSERRVLLVEQQKTIGGLFGGFLGPFGELDHGAHILQETGHHEWDDLLYDALPQSEWHIFEGVRRDIAGNFFQDRLNLGAVYPDLRDLDGEQFQRCLGDLFANLPAGVPAFAQCDSLERFFQSRFGKLVTEAVFKPIAAKLWRKDLGSLSAWAAKVIHMTRIVVTNSAVSLRMKDSPLLDQIIGFPDQLDFPEHRLDNRLRSLYPKSFGLRRLVEALQVSLAKAGVEIATDTSIARMETGAGRVLRVDLQSSAGTRNLDVDEIVWSSPLPALLGRLGTASTPFTDAPLPHRAVYLYLKHAPATGPLYWFFCYDTRFAAVRIANYAAYCPNAASSGQYPVCVETHVDPAATEPAICAQSIAELQAMGIIGGKDDVAHAFAGSDIKSYFVPSIANLNVLAEQRAAAAALGLSNLHLHTPSLADGIFYLPEILISGLAFLHRLCGASATPR